MIEIEVAVEIRQKPPVVFNFITDLDKSSLWQSGMKESFSLSEEPMNVGSRYVQETSFLGQRLRTTFEITVFKPGLEFSAQSVEGPFPLHLTRSIEPCSSGSRLITRVQGDPGSYFKLPTFILKKMVESAIKSDCISLQKQLNERI